MTDCPKYPLTRAGFTCPLCLGSKDSELIVCWSCYKHTDMRYGTSEPIERELGRYERNLVALEALYRKPKLSLDTVPDGAIPGRSTEYYQTFTERAAGSIGSPKRR